MAARDRETLAALQDEALTRAALQSLRRTYVEWAWPILEPAAAFLGNWHLDLICEYLEAVSAGQIRRLVINLPPRYGKSLLVSVLWPTWEWITHPSTRWLFVSYSEVLASRHSLDRRRLLLSAWYRQHWGHVIRLTKDQQAKLEFHNTRRGMMVATSVGGSVTGKGGNRLVMDDPHNPLQAESDVQRAHAIDFYTQTLSTRLDDKQQDATVLVMQRLHTQDLTARCLELGFTHLCLPALAPARTTITFPRSGQIRVREAEEPLWPAREPRPVLDEQRQLLGRYGFAGQYQQDPIPRTGGYFQRDWWGWYDDAPAAFDEVVQSWDPAFKDGDGSDYAVGLLAGRIGATVYVLDRFKAKASFVDTCRTIEGMVAREPRTQRVLVGDAANGPAVVNALQQRIRGSSPSRQRAGRSRAPRRCSPRLRPVKSCYRARGVRMAASSGRARG